MADNTTEDRNKEKCRDFLKHLTHSRHMIFTSRGNTAIDLAIKSAKGLGFSKLLIPRDGSWLHYPIVGKKKDLDVSYIDTVNGMIDVTEVSNKLDSDTILLFHSNAGYFQKIDVERIYKISREKKSLMVIDCSGALGLGYCDKSLESLYSSDNCDILVSSLRKNKPVEADGGFVATNSERIWNAIKENSDSDFSMDYGFLLERLSLLERRMRFLVGLTKKYSEDLKKNGLNAINDDNSLVIIIPFDDLKTKESIINYCEINNLEYEICPREIRVLRNAISIEIKRLKEEFEDAGKKS